MKTVHSTICGLGHCFWKDMLLLFFFCCFFKCDFSMLTTTTTNEIPFTYILLGGNRNLRHLSAWPDTNGGL